MSDYSFLPQKKSIHIVIFTGGAYPEPAVTSSYWKSHVPEFVIAADSGLDAAQRYAGFYAGMMDFTPRRIVGDFDSLSDRNILAQYPPDIVEHFPADKDWTDTELAIERAYGTAEQKNRSPFITLVGGDGGRVDHLLGIYDTFASPHHVHVWLLSAQKLYYAEAGTTAEISRLTVSDTVSVARTTVSRTGGILMSRGLKWESSVFRREGMPSISNRISDQYAEKGAPVELSAGGMPFLFIVPYTAEIRFLPKES